MTRVFRCSNRSDLLPSQFPDLHVANLHVPICLSRFHHAGHACLSMIHRASAGDLVKEYEPGGHNEHNKEENFIR